METQNVLAKITEIADDFLCHAIIEKAIEPKTSHVISWFAAHSIELALKSSCLKLEIKIKNSHELDKIFKKLNEVYPQGNVWPTPLHFASYRKTFIVHNDTATFLPDGGIEELMWVELAYWVSNVGDLKYGFNTKWEHVSPINIGYDGMNHVFLALIRQLRSNYKDSVLDARLILKIQKMFPGSENRTKIVELLGL